ncbi:MAG TPA: hypothetical protein VE570_00245 [Thermoleophilaceae bacterium]|nr:hypothetical protein [Thermoleophilaceae bacterium]
MLIGRILALAVGLALLAGPPEAQGADRPLRHGMRVAASQIDWTNLTNAERRRVVRRWNRAPALLDVLLDRVAPGLAVHRTRGTELAQGNSTDLNIGGLDRPWQINLSPLVLHGGDKLSAHITSHELGHVIDGALADDAWRAAFFAALSRSPLWQPCWPMPPGSSSRCVRGNEIFADQFAFWATARRDVRSSYGVPPLMHRAELGVWLARLPSGPLGRPRSNVATIGPAVERM